MKTSFTNSMFCTLIHLIKNQLEAKRHEIASLSQYTTKVIRESYNAEVEELVAIKSLLEKNLKQMDEPQPPTSSKKK